MPSLVNQSVPKGAWSGLNVTLAEARVECQLQGAVLCSPAIAATGICCRTGCGMDSKLVWLEDGRLQQGCTPANVVPWSSQVGQDHLVHTLLGADHKGFFIDLASNDPIALSNTRALETLGYRGLCIEPNPVYYPLYKLARRRCTLVPYAVSAKRGTVRFGVSRQHAKKNSPLAALGDVRAAVFGGIVAPGLDNANASTSETVQVGAVTFDEILHKYPVPSVISYLSLDVEGAEGLVMESFPWHTHVLSLVTVERPKADLRSKFVAHGYRHLCNSGDFGDELWAHSSTRFDVPSLARWPPAQCPKANGIQIARCRSLIDPSFNCSDGFSPRAESVSSPCDSLSARLNEASCRNYSRTFASSWASVIANVKGVTHPERHIDIMSDPNNLFVPRCVDAGRLVRTASEETWVVLHNGIQVLSRAYYGDFAKVLETNLGVHEGAEERLFGEVLPLLPPGSVMLELGSYWAMYSTWFGRAVRGARLFLVEASAHALGIGLRNLAHNRLQPELATRGYVGVDVNVSSLVASRGLRHVHMLHADIQGEEAGMLSDIAPLLRARRVSYIFLSTHSQELHLSCLETLRSYGYRIIGQMDVDSDTFFFDGLIVASESSLTAPAAVDLGSRRATPQREGPFDGMRTRRPCPYAHNPHAGGGKTLNRATASRR